MKQMDNLRRNYEEFTKKGGEKKGMFQVGKGLPVPLSLVLNSCVWLVMIVS